MKKLLLFIALITTSLIQASEYILYKEGTTKDNKKLMLLLNEQEHAAAYDVLTNYQFPMSLCSNATQKLSTKELAALDANEEQFLQSKMPAGVKVAFIPKVLYELLFLKFYMDDVINNTTANTASTNSSHKENNNTKEYDLLELYYYTSAYRDQLVPLITKNGWDQQAYYKGVYSLVSENSTRNLHYQLNTRITNYLDHPHTLNIKSNINKLTQEIMQSLQSYSHKPVNVVMRTLQGYIQKKYSPEHLFYTIAIHEIEAHNKNAWLLYRGTHPLSATHVDATISGQHFHSISYGSSFFGNILGDLGANPYFFTIKSSIGYTCMVSKADYRQQGLSHALFFIPPFSTLVSWALQGEFTHPRTKIHTSVEQAKNHIAGNGIHGVKELPIECLFTNKQKFKTAADFEKTFQTYLTKNIRIIKDDRKATASAATAAAPLIKSKL